MQDLKEVVKLGISLANALGKSLEDGELSMGDVMSLWPVALDLPDAVDGIENAYRELKQLDKEQMKALGDYVKEEFDIPQDGIEAIIESSLEIISSIRLKL